MSYVIFRGVGTEGSADVVGSGNVLSNVYVSKMPDHHKAAMRQTEYHVKGRDGDLHVNEGYENFDLTLKLVLINASASTRQLVNAWADGTGKLITSDDLTKAYKATVADEVEWNRIKANGGYYDTATITFNCDPFMYEAVDSVIALTSSQALLNPGSADAFPLIKVEAASDGDVSMTIAGTPITISGMTTSVPVFIDCANGYVYTPNGAAKTMTGNIPYFDLGSNSISFGSNLARLTITPHWRWV